MAYLKNPSELELYRFLSPTRRAMVDEFFSKLDEDCREFALKRYTEGKTIPTIAREMGYSERNLFKFRRKILFRWYFMDEIVSQKEWVKRA
ncbi:hypothetical protein CEB3_c17810 [Peptococcaceae bacterium CEB3]|nr:hypothetical protein CEB3_c17810 [Peptococcaceae bacterium CEB3]